MWDEGIVSVDANILLHVYRYSPPLRDTLFVLMEKLGNRLSVPDRAAYEFRTGSRLSPARKRRTMTPVVSLKRLLLPSRVNCLPATQ